MKKTIFFVHIFDISPCGFTQIVSTRAHWQRVPTLHTFDGPRYPKNKKYLKKHDDDVIITFFSGISWFWDSEFCQKYAVWVLVGCRIKFHIQWALLLEIWVKKKEICWKYKQKKYFLYDTYPQIYIKKVFKTYTVFQI